MNYLPKYLRARTLAEIALDELQEHRLSLLRAQVATVHARTALTRSELLERHHKECIEVLKEHQS